MTSLADNPFLAGADPSVLSPSPVDQKMERAREAKRRKRSDVVRDLIARAEAADLHHEDQRKRTYIIDQVDAGRASSDAAMLLETLEQIVKRYESRQ